MIEAFIVFAFFWLTGAWLTDAKVSSYVPAHQWIPKTLISVGLIFSALAIYQAFTLIRHFAIQV